MTSQSIRRIAAAAVWAAAGIGWLPAPSNGEEPAKKDRHVFVEVCVAEVSVSKLRALGFDLNTTLLDVQRDGGRTADMIAFLDTLRKDNLVSILSRPQLATMNGRPASLQIGDALKLDIAPQVIDPHAIQLEYRIELRQAARDAAQDVGDERPRQKATQFTLSSATELEPGQLYCVSQTHSRRIGERGKTEEIATIVLLRAGFEPPQEVRTAEKLPPRPMLDGRYREVAPLQR